MKENRIYELEEKTNKGLTPSEKQQKYAEKMNTVSGTNTVSGNNKKAN